MLEYKVNGVLLINYDDCMKEKVSPYEDWIARGKPSFLFVYRIRKIEFVDRLEVMFLPYDRLIIISEDDGDMWYSCRTVMDEDSKSITITHFSDLEKMVQIRKWVRNFANYLFCNTDSRWAVRKAKKPEITNIKQDLAVYKSFENKSGCRKIGACCYSYMKGNKEATIIQAVFKGWRVRMKYRFSPHTTLGKWLLLKQFRDLQL